MSANGSTASEAASSPVCNVFYHHKVNVPIVLGNLSLKLGRSIRFDPATEKIVGDPEAAARLRARVSGTLEIPGAIPVGLLDQGRRTLRIPKYSL